MTSGPSTVSRLARPQAIDFLAVKACPKCGEKNSDRARFCQVCGSALADAPAAAREERKVVTVLFCDLVGFTASSDQADPEDVRARIRPYHARLRTEIERYGGTVEKFIGGCRHGSLRGVCGSRKRRRACRPSLPAGHRRRL